MEVPENLALGLGSTIVDDHELWEFTDSFATAACEGWTPKSDADENDPRYDQWWLQKHYGTLRVIEKTVSRFMFNPGEGYEEYVIVSKKDYEFLLQAAVFDSPEEMAEAEGHLDDLMGDA
jgi:hypothetical protein